MIIQPNITDDGAGLRGANATGRLARSAGRLVQDVQAAGAAEVAARRDISAGPAARVRQVHVLSDRISAAVTRVRTQSEYLDRAHSALARMTELSRQAADPALAGPDREAVRVEFAALARTLGEVAAQRLDGEPLFDGSVREVPVDSRGRTLRLKSPALDRAVYARVQAARLETPEAAAEAVRHLEAAVGTLDEERAGVAAGRDALLQAAETLQVERQNLAAATVRLRGAGEAEAVARQVSVRISVRADEALRAQAHAQPERVLGLLS
ncbi:flagellin [Limisphaera sp. 4302-co]|uniref:flagellin n=1 Tax=Limisphaera sp. 4302-co TaxID=3400417 RepID=UPI003C229E4F